MGQFADRGANFLTTPTFTCVTQRARACSRVPDMCFCCLLCAKGGSEEVCIHLLHPVPPAHRCSRTSPWACGAPPTPRLSSAPPPPPPRRVAASSLAGTVLCVGCESFMESHLLVSSAERLILGPLAAYVGYCEQWTWFRYVFCALATSDLRPCVFLHFVCCTRSGHKMVRGVRIMLRDGVFRHWGW